MQASSLLKPEPKSSSSITGALGGLEDPDEGAAFGFRNKPQRFLIRTYNGKKATIYPHGILFNKLIYGGRKSTRKNRKTNRKTYRILPRVEGS